MMKFTGKTSQRQHRHLWHTLEKEELIQIIEQLISEKEKLAESLEKTFKAIAMLTADNQALRIELNRFEKTYRELKQEIDALRITWSELAGSSKEERLVIYNQNREIIRLREVNTIALAHHSQRSSTVSPDESKSTEEDHDDSEMSVMEKEDEYIHCSADDLERFQASEKQSH